MQKHTNTRICGAFITLENNMKEVEKVLKENDFILFDKFDVNIKRAKEPSNYIWENMATTRKELIARKSNMVLKIGLILGFCYWI